MNPLPHNVLLQCLYEKYLTCSQYSSFLDAHTPLYKLGDQTRSDHMQKLPKA